MHFRLYRNTPASVPKNDILISVLLTNLMVSSYGLSEFHFKWKLKKNAFIV